jgi:hypothetical protein
MKYLPHNLECYINILCQSRCNITIAEHETMEKFKVEKYGT